MTEKLTKEAKQLKMRSSSAIYRILHKILHQKTKISQDKEHLWIMLLDNASNIKSIELISIGTIKEVQANPMEIYSIALHKRATNIILAHNHPSGELLPSIHDINTTDQIIQVGKMHGIQVLDNLIINKETYFSFRDSGLLLELEMSLKYIPQYKFWDKVKEILSNEEYLTKAKSHINACI